MADLVDLSPEDYQFAVDNRVVSASELRDLDATSTWPLSPLDERAQVEAAAAASPFVDAHSSPDDGPRSRLIMPRTSRGRRSAAGGQLSDSSALDFTTDDFATASLWLRSTGGVVSPLRTTSLMSSGTPVDPLGNLVAGHSPGDSPAGDWFSNPGWAPSLVGLAPLLTWDARDKAWIVVGSTFDDFALAHALARMSHHCVWLPSEWLETGSPWAPVAAHLLMRFQGRFDLDEVRVTSVSMDPATAIERCESVERHDMRVVERGSLKPVAVDGIPIASERLLLALQHDHAHEIALPTRRSANGDRVLVARLPALVPQTADVIEWPVDWVTDVVGTESAIPEGRHYPSRSLQTDERPWYEHLRCGRDGTSYIGRSTGFVSSGATLEQAAARPRLVFPALQTWLRTVVAQSGNQLETSQAGYTTQLASSLWPSRALLAEDLATLGPIFELFSSHTTLHSERYPDKEGYVLGREGYPLFDGLNAAGKACGLNEQETRSVIDRLVVDRIFRRGLILRCGQCTKEQFVVTPESRVVASGRVVYGSR
jgi:hypothetical protein